MIIWYLLFGGKFQVGDKGEIASHPDLSLQSGVVVKSPCNFFLGSLDVAR